jgi:hypothetical protein
MLTLDQQSAWRDVIRSIKRAVPMRQALRIVGWPVCGKRAECRLKEHSQKLTVAFNERTWFCHACNIGGDQITLIELAHRCDRSTAIRFLAAEARVELPGSRRLSAEERRRLRRESEEREQREKQLDGACEDFEGLERAERAGCARQIHACDRALSTLWPWSERQWQQARAAHILREEFLLPEYTVLSFAPMERRLQYLMGDEQERAAMLRDVRWRGGLTTDNDHFVEAVT